MPGNRDVPDPQPAPDSSAEGGQDGRFAQPLRIGPIGYDSPHWGLPPRLTSNGVKSERENGGEIVQEAACAQHRDRWTSTASGLRRHRLRFAAVIQAFKEMAAVAAPSLSMQV